MFSPEFPFKLFFYPMYPSNLQWIVSRPHRYNPKKNVITSRVIKIKLKLTISLMKKPKSWHIWSNLTNLITSTGVFYVPARQLGSSYHYAHSPQPEIRIWICNRIKSQPPLEIGTESSKRRIISIGQDPPEPLVVQEDVAAAANKISSMIS